jgi:hypothetical protein
MSCGVAVDSANSHGSRSGNTSEMDIGGQTTSCRRFCSNQKEFALSIKDGCSTTEVESCGSVLDDAKSGIR